MNCSACKANMANGNIGADIVDISSSCISVSVMILCVECQATVTGDVEIQDAAPCGSCGSDMEDAHAGAVVIDEAQGAVEIDITCPSCFECVSEVIHFAELDES